MLMHNSAVIDTSQQEGLGSEPRFKFSLWVLWFVTTPQRHHVRLTGDSTLAEGAEDWYPVQGVTCILT